MIHVYAFSSTKYPSLEFKDRAAVNSKNSWLVNHEVSMNFNYLSTLNQVVSAHHNICIR